MKIIKFVLAVFVLGVIGVCFSESNSTFLTQEEMMEKLKETTSKVQAQAKQVYDTIAGMTKNFTDDPAKAQEAFGDAWSKLAQSAAYSYEQLLKQTQTLLNSTSEVKPSN